LEALGRDPTEAGDLITDFNSNADKMNFRDFLVIMNTLENRLRAGAQEAGDAEEPAEATLEDRNKYGPLLPRTGVHFLPDSKVVDFLK
jgi:hypothetical protein